MANNNFGKGVDELVREAQTSLNFPSTKKPNQRALDKEVKDMFKNREEGLNYINKNFDNPKDKQNALNRLDRVYPSLKDRFDKYIKYGFRGNNVDKWNKEIEDIESQMPFKDKAEHDKWLDMSAAWKGEPEWLDMTYDIIKRRK